MRRQYENPRPRALLAALYRGIRRMRHSMKDRVTLVYHTYGFVHLSLHKQLEEGHEPRPFGELLALLERSKPDFDGRAELLQRLRALNDWVEHGSSELRAGRFKELNHQSEPYVRESAFLLRRVLRMARSDPEAASTPR